MRGVEISGCGAVTDVMAREESPWTFDGLYGDDWPDRRAVDAQQPCLTVSELMNRICPARTDDHISSVCALPNMRMRDLTYHYTLLNYDI